MKRMIFIRTWLLAVILAAAMVTGCKKEPLNEGNSDTTAIEQLSNDENNIENVLDDAMVDADGVMGNGSGQLKSGLGIPCNATLDSIGIVHDSILIRITYHGLSCNGTHNRSGKIEISRRIGAHWGQSGTSVRIRYIDFAVTRVSNGKTVTINGVKVFQNVSGGAIWQLGISRTSIVHRASGYLTMQFDNGTSRVWNVARQCTYTGSQGDLMVTVDGFGGEGSYSNLVTWGTTRSGENFYSRITQSVVHKQSCQFDPVSGIKLVQVPGVNKSATLTFGFNGNNEPVTGDECPSKFRFDWTNGTHSGTKYLELH